MQAVDQSIAPTASSRSPRPTRGCLIDDYSCCNIDQEFPLPSVSVVNALAGVSSLFGLLSLLAYFFIGQKGERTDSIVDVMGHRVDLELEIKLLKQFRTDAARLKALKQRHEHKDALAVAILAKIKGNVDVQHGAKSRDRRYLIAAVVFVVLALLAVLSPLVPHGPAAAAQAPAALPVPTLPTQAFAPIQAAAPSEPEPRPAPVFAFRWERAQPGGTPYSQAFPVTTENRHNRSNAMASASITVSQLTGQPGTEKRITRAEYSCGGGGCAWSVNPAGRPEGHYEVHPQGLSVTWKRVWDGDPVVETNTVFYDVFTRYCSANCP
jgi:hypothetical protein